MESGILGPKLNVLCFVLILFLQRLVLVSSASLQDYNGSPDGSVISNFGRCPDGLIFDPYTLVCYNPCSLYTPLPNVARYYVASPSSDSTYYICSTNGTFIQQQCPAGNQFHQALGSIQRDPCLSQSALDEMCPLNAYMVMPLLPGDNCPFISLTPYYVLCNNGRAIIQRCPFDLIHVNGICTTVNLCNRPNISVDVKECICG